MDVVSEVDVVVLVAMPGTPSVPHASNKVEHEDVGANSSPREDHLWTNYVVGVAQAPFQRDASSQSHSTGITTLYV